jgi:hypothetical protein
MTSDRRIGKASVVWEAFCFRTYARLLRSGRPVSKVAVGPKHATQINACKASFFGRASPRGLPLKNRMVTAFAIARPSTVYF